MADSDGASTPAQATNEAPPRRWGIAGFVASGLAVSAAIHLALVGTVLVAGSWGGPRAQPVTAVPVDVVTPDQLAALSEKADPKSDSKPDPKPDSEPDSKPEPKTDPKPDLKPDLQPPAKFPVPDTAAQPPTPPPSQSVALPPPSPPPPSQPQLDAFAPPLAPSDAPPPVPPAPPAPPASADGQAAQLAQMLALPPPVAGLSGGPPSDIKANLTSREIAGFAAHVQSCWTPLPASVKAANITVFVRVRLRRDGSLAGDPEPLGGSATMQALTLLQSSLKVLKRCPAYTALPADKYDEWRVLDIHFTPNGISTAAPGPRSAAHRG